MQARGTSSLINLITNASDALAGKEGRITLTTTRQGDDIILRVQDTGHGMSDTVLADELIDAVNQAIAKEKQG